MHFSSNHQGLKFISKKNHHVNLKTKQTEINSHNGLLMLYLHPSPPPCNPPPHIKKLNKQTNKQYLQNVIHCLEMDKLLAKKTSDLREVQVVDAMEDICQSKYFKTYDLSPPTTIKVCKFLIGELSNNMLLHFS